MSYWIKAIGTSLDRLPDDWYSEWPDALGRTYFPKRPSIRSGDFLVYYAAGRYRVCAIMEVLSDAIKLEAGDFPENWTDEMKARWPWAVLVCPRITIAVDDNAPTLEQIGIKNLSMRRQSHISISQDQFRVAAQAIANAVQRSWGISGQYNALPSAAA